MSTSPFIGREFSAYWQLQIVAGIAGVVSAESLVCRNVNTRILRPICERRKQAPGFAEARNSGAILNFGRWHLIGEVLLPLFQPLGIRKHV